MNNVAPGSSNLRSVAFVIPAHNEKDYLEATVKALHQAARSLQLDYEILVVNDASTDATPEIAAENDCRVIDVELRNIGAVRNAGAKATTRPWLIFVDADTIVPEATLAQTVDLLSRGYLGGGARVQLSDEKRISLFKLLMFWLVVLIWHILGRWAAGCYMFCRRETFEDFGGFDERFYAAEELFFSRQIKKRGQFKLVSAPVITSSRKLHNYSSWELIGFLFAPLKRFWAPLRSREGLDLLYKDER